MRTLVKNSREQIVIRRQEYRGRHFIDVRKFYQGADGEPRPTRQGIMITVDRAIDLADAIRAVARQEVVDAE
jgi:hypothetical protein